MAEEDPRFGVRLRGGLPASNGLSPRAEELADETTTIVFGVVTMRVAAVTHNTENDSRTSSMKLLALETQLEPAELEVVRLIIDRARVRRTGEQPMFDHAGMPEDPQALLSAVPDLPTPPTPPKKRASRRRS